MHTATRFLILAAAFASVAFLPDASAGRASTAPRSKHSKLATPAEVGAAGRLDSIYYRATKTRAERSRLVLTIKKLPPRSDFSLVVTYRPTIFDATETWFLPNEVRTNKFGQAKVVWDTKDGGALPLGGTLKDLVGHVLRVENAAKQVVLVGRFPASP